MSKEKNPFKQNPAKTLLLLISLFLIITDLIMGLFLIPKDNDYYNTFRTSHTYYHHGLKPNQKALAKGINGEFFLYTNSLGFRDSSIREVPLKSRKKRILFIGDSFTEGIGVTYQESYVGILNKTIDTAKTELLNAGVVSYSPKLYYLKTKYLIEKKRLHFDELIVFMDISDPMDEIIYKDYEIGKKPKVFYKPTDFVKTKNLLKHISYTYYSLTRFHHRNDPHPLIINKAYEAKVENYPWKDYYKERETWTSDSIVLKKWGIKGLKLAKKNMKHLLHLCQNHNIKMNIVVYPYPYHILNERENCLQVSIWKKFCFDHKIEFIDLFPLFIQNKSPETIILKNFFIDDIHWNENGHHLVSREILKHIN